MGDPKDVLENIKNSTLLRQQDLSKLAWRCADEKFFKEVTNILRRKQLYNSKIWKYALVLNYNAYERNTYRHIEFFKKDENILGLFNSRIQANNLLNKHQRFSRVYRDFLIRCLYRSHGVKTMSVDDQFSAIFYLIAQNRIKEANNVFKAVDNKKAKKQSPMLYDYIAVFLSFFEKDSEKALEKQDIVHKWLAVKLPTKKRKMWAAVKRQLTELQNRQKTLAEFQDSENAKKAKQTAPKLNFVIDAAKKQIRLKSKNIASIIANFYAINIEQLFSNSPFTAGKDALSYVQPTTSLTIETKKKEVAKKKKDSSDSDSSDDDEKEKKPVKEDKDKETITTIDFPKNFNEKSNFVLEALDKNNNNDSNVRVVKTQYNNTLYVEFNTKRGDLFVGNFSKFPVVKAYVKVYLATKKNPNGFFIKDGYTDLRGRSDYLATATALPDDATKVAVLVVSDACGANIYYAQVQK